MSVIAFYGLEGGVIQWGKVTVYPRGMDSYGNDVMVAHATNFKADILISLMDAWVIRPEEFGKGPDRTKWVPWFPVDSDPLAPEIMHRVKEAYARICFSQFGVKMVENAGMDAYYVPHGVDTKLFKPMDQAEAREARGWPKDKFIIGMVAANKGNPSRKAFTQQLEAYAHFHERHPDTLLYLHTLTGEHGEGMGVNLAEFCAWLKLEIGKDVLFADRYGAFMGYPPEQMREIYAGMDVHMLVSMGEGFGIPILEAQACGVPVIVGDWTAMSELCFSGWKVPKSEAQPWWTPLATYQFSPNIGAIEDALEEAYQYARKPAIREKARKGALAYDADRVMKTYWKPVLKAIQEKIEAEAESLAAGAHVHDWAANGLFNPDGSMSIPCKKADCMAELIATRDGEKTVVEDGFSTVIDGVALDIEDDPQGSVAKIVFREIGRDYEMKNLDLEPGDVVLDIGAQVGIVSIFLTKKYPGIRVMAFEPVPENYQRMLRNIEANGAEGIETFELAVTGDGRDLALAGDLSTNSGGVGLFGSGKDSFKVKSISLQEILSGLKGERVKLLKMDCEGAEYEILGQANGLLKNIDAIRGEFHAFGGNDPMRLLAEVQAKVPDTKVSIAR